MSEAPLAQTARPFVDYYAQNDISPVRQDIADLDRHFERRGALYRLLGISPLAVRGRRVLEFGPGSGHNALYTASLEPQRYVLVDANPRGLAETRATLGARYGDRVEIAVVDSLVEDFRSAESFDLVLAENLIPFQHEPAEFVRTIAGFAGDGALVVLTCIDAVSHLAEIGRRLIAWRIAPPSLPLSARVSRLIPVFAPHVATLTAMSRSVEDWILDNITHPLIGRTFSIPDALGSMDAQFDVFGSSPAFTTEWRWYKELFGDARRYNERAAQAYFANVINLLDYRHTEAPHDPAMGRAIAVSCERVYRAMQLLESGSSNDFGPACSELRTLAALVQPIAASTASSIDELAAVLEAPADAPPAAPSFASFFGRGTQYLSFVRRPSPRSGA